jgi:UDP-N-acetylmuramoyl-tripeptide--D-alanyl-D-alanine ligase
MELRFVWAARRRRAWRRAMLLYRSSRTAAGRKKLRYGIYGRVAGFVWRLALAYRRTLIRHVRLVAVVGSFGKTTTTRATAVALGHGDPYHDGDNNALAVAAHLLQVRPSMRHAVIEVGIDDKGQMERLARRLRPDITVVTCVGSEHLTSFGALETTRSEKARMVSAVPPSGLVILNGDDPNVMWMKTVARAPVITYGFNEANDVRASDVEDSDIGGIRFRAHAGGDAYDIRTRLLGRHMVYPCLAAVAVAHAEGFTAQCAVAALEKLEPTHNRLQPTQLASGVWIVLDAYKGALETIQAALETVSRLPARRRIVVIGDVEEPPGSQGPIYKTLGRRLAEVADGVVFIGGKTNFNRLKRGMIPGGLSRESLHNLRNAPQAIADFLGSELRPNDVVLIKGRSTQHLERILLILSGSNVACSAEACLRRHDCATCALL